jgi:dihydroorotate dehydrogenase (NAD+) catalytic subunit
MQLGTHSSEIEASGKFKSETLDSGNLGFKIGSLALRTPLMPASGCFGPELGKLIPIEEIGAVMTKTVFADQRAGNPPNRISEIYSGMVNSVGIPSIGLNGFLETLAPQYDSLPAPTIISIGGFAASHFAYLAEALSQHAEAFELNVSCPNLEQVEHEIGNDPELIHEVVLATRNITSKALIVKLSPMVTSISECALAAQEAGADAVCVSNSIPCMPIDSISFRPMLGNGVGGLSGPAIKPIILRLVRQVYETIRIPVIGCGGIAELTDVLEYIAAGASAVQIGTANFSRPFAMIEIARELDLWCIKNEIVSHDSLLRKLVF